MKLSTRVKCRGGGKGCDSNCVRGSKVGVIARRVYNALYLSQLLPQHLFLMETKGRVIRSHGEEKQKLVPGLPVVELKPIVVDDRVDMCESSEKDPGCLPVVRIEQCQGDQQFAPDHLVRYVGQGGQVGGVVSLDLGITERVVVLSGQILQGAAQKPKLYGHTEV